MDISQITEINNVVILDAFMKCQQVFSQHEHALVSISGGADSDCLLDLCERVRQIEPIEIEYAWFNTGFEYEATKRHLDYLEERYSVHIHRVRPEKSIPTCAREYGQPFMSKIVSERLERLQRHGFQWEDEPFDILNERYKRCRTSLHWWTNSYTRIPGVPGQYDIGRKRWLKEYIIENPPTFRISNKCCDYTKKKVSANFIQSNDIDLDVLGVRRSERGMRSMGGKHSAGNSCFTPNYSKTGVDRYKPMFWFRNEDKEAYATAFGIRHSDCYTKYGFKRTGCAGCPYNLLLNIDMKATELFEPMLYKAMWSVFGEAYEYTNKYYEFRKRMDEQRGDQLNIPLRFARLPE